jgi:hypothetical protein
MREKLKLKKKTLEGRADTAAEGGQAVAISGGGKVEPHGAFDAVVHATPQVPGNAAREPMSCV